MYRISVDLANLVDLPNFVDLPNLTDSPKFVNTPKTMFLAGFIETLRALAWGKDDSFLAGASKIITPWRLRLLG